MTSERALLVAGLLLLSTSALLGFAQARARGQPELFAKWRVVHSGGTAGAVQLLALAAVWSRFTPRTPGSWLPCMAAGIIVATLAFFAGSVASALAWERTSRALLLTGAGIAIPTYLALPLAAF